MRRAEHKGLVMNEGAGRLRGRSKGPDHGLARLERRTNERSFENTCAPSDFPWAWTHGRQDWRGLISIGIANAWSRRRTVRVLSRRGCHTTPSLESPAILPRRVVSDQRSLHLSRFFRLRASRGTLRTSNLSNPAEYQSAPEHLPELRIARSGDLKSLSKASTVQAWGGGGQGKRKKVVCRSRRP